MSKPIPKLFLSFLILWSGLVFGGVNHVHFGSDQSFATIHNHALDVEHHTKGHHQDDSQEALFLVAVYDLPVRLKTDLSQSVARDQKQTDLGSDGHDSLSARTYFFGECPVSFRDPPPDFLAPRHLSLSSKSRAPPQAS